MVRMEISRSRTVIDYIDHSLGPSRHRQSHFSELENFFNMLAFGQLFVMDEYGWTGNRCTASTRGGASSLLGHSSISYTLKLVYISV